MGLCRELSTNGTCTTPSCTFSHDVTLFCFDCNALCPTAFHLSQHLNGKRHELSLKNRRVQVGNRCNVCDVLIPGGPNARQIHNAGARHQKNLITNGVSDTSEGVDYCDVCSRSFLTVGDAARHRRTADHQKRMRFSAVAATLREAQKNKYDISVSHENGVVDFDFIDISGLASQSVLRINVSIKSSSSQVQLSSVRLLSTNNTYNSQNVFSADINTPVQLRQTSAFLVPITFAPGTLRGYFSDHLELTFRNIVQGQNFSVSRTIRAVVGVEADHQLLRASAPYVRPPPRVPTTTAREYLRGPKPPSRLTIPYIIDLPQYPFDDAFVTTGPLAQRIRTIKRALPATLDGQTYQRHWSALLHVEENQMLSDMEAYDLHDVVLTSHEKFYYLQVPGLAEKRPSVLTGDSVHVRLKRNPDIEYEGRVHVVREQEIGLRFHARFVYRPGDLCDAFFTVCRIPLRRMHQALDCPFFPDRVLFPAVGHTHGLQQPTHAQLAAIHTMNPLVAGNPPQLLAVASIVNRPPGSVPFTIFGPPGTGKTVTLMEAIVQVLQKDPTARILACAPSNSAADLIAQRLLHLGPRVLFRMNAPSRFKNRVPDNLLDFSFRDRDGHFSVESRAKMMTFRVVVSTCLSASIPHGIGMPAGHFSHIFIDEAGQAMEPEVMVPIKTMADPRTNIILSGDPMQLGPIIRSAVASRLGLENSFLNRLMSRDIYDETVGTGLTMVKLTKNWRSHESILEFPNNTFYNGDLEVCGSRTVINSLLDSPVLARRGFPIVFHGIAGLDEREAGSPSFFNKDEISLIAEYVEQLRRDRAASRRITDHDIGVISPYNAQGKKLRLRLNAEYIKVGSVEEFQGQERRVILITTVRSQQGEVTNDLAHMLGFLVNPRRMNVALTRAQAMLVIVGNPRILSLDSLWRSFLSFVYRNGGWKADGLQPEWDTNEDDGDDANGGGMEMEALTERIRNVVLADAQTGRGEDEAEYDETRREANEDRGPWREEE